MIINSSKVQVNGLHRAMQREFYKHRISKEYKKMKSKYKKLKRNTIKTMYSLCLILRSLTPAVGSRWRKISELWAKCLSVKY